MKREREWASDPMQDAHSILLHIPHASTVIPDRFADLFVLDHMEMKEELLVMTDHHTDALFELDDADRLVFPVSRLLVDPERFRDDAQEPMSSRGMGVVYTKTHHGRDLKSDRMREMLVEEYYDPHHSAMGAWASDRLRRHGRCLIIDCHSFPRRPLPCDLDQTASRPDICIGTSSLHTTDTVDRASRSAFEARGYTVEVNRPYEGTIVPPRCLGKDPFVQSIMIEVGRWPYMDEATGERLSTFETCQESVQAAMGAIVEAWRGNTARQEEKEQVDDLPRRLRSQAGRDPGEPKTKVP